MTPFNPLDPDFPAQRYANYRSFRETDPVHVVRNPDGTNTWYLFRHADVSNLLRDGRFLLGYRKIYPERRLTRFPAQFAALNAETSAWLLFRDPPEHTRLRALINKAFTPRIVQKLEPHIAEIADELLDEGGLHGPFEFMSGYAWALPATVIAELLGVERGYRRRLRELGADISKAVGGSASLEVLGRADDACVELQEYFDHRLEERLRSPGDDLLSGLAAAQEKDDRLAKSEVASMCILLLFAGHETTLHLLSNGVLALLRHPEELARLRADPSLDDSAVEELLRYDAPVQIVFRVAAEDVEIDGHRIARGERVGAVLGSANHDPAQYADPDRLDLSRAPGRLASFGMGIHYCAGAALARAEGRIGIRRLIDRYPGLRLADEAVRWQPSLVFSSLERLNVVLAR